MKSATTTYKVTEYISSSNVGSYLKLGGQVVFFFFGGGAQSASSNQHKVNWFAKIAHPSPTSLSSTQQTETGTAFCLKKFYVHYVFPCISVTAFRRDVKNSREIHFKQLTVDEVMGAKCILKYALLSILAIIA